MTYAASLSTGRITTSVADAIVTPRWYRTPRHGAVYSHGGNGVPSYIGLGSGSKHFIQLARDYGIVTAGNLHGSLPWGNATAQSRARASKTYLHSTHNVPTGPVIAIGVSMGTANSLRWAADHPSEVMAVISFLPAFDLDDIRDNDRMSSQDTIDTAWGVTYPDPLPAGANPALRQDELIDLPILMFYATNDQFIPTSIVTDWVADMPNASAHSVGALDHTDAAIAAADSSILASFVSQLID